MFSRTSPRSSPRTPSHLGSGRAIFGACAEASAGQAVAQGSSVARILANSSMSAIGLGTGVRAETFARPSRARVSAPAMGKASPCRTLCTSPRVHKRLASGWSCSQPARFRLRLWRLLRALQSSSRRPIQQTRSPPTATSCLVSLSSSAERYRQPGCRHQARWMGIVFLPCYSETSCPRAALTAGDVAEPLEVIRHGRR